MFSRERYGMQERLGSYNEELTHMGLNERSRAFKSYTGGALSVDSYIYIKDEE